MELTLHDAQVAYAELLVEIGAIELDAMNQWLTSLTETPVDIAQGVCEAGLISEFELTRRIAAHTGLPIASDIELDMYASLNPHIMRELCVELFMVPMSDAPEDPFPVALTNPLDEEGLAFICEQVGASASRFTSQSPRISTMRSSLATGLKSSGQNTSLSFRLKDLDPQGNRIASAPRLLRL